MDPIIINFLAKLEMGELQTLKNMAIIPLFSSVNYTPRYLSLGEALGKGLLTVTEVSQTGAVPELKVVNKADLPVLLLDGEERACRGQAEPGAQHYDPGHGTFGNHHPGQLHRAREVGLRRPGLCRVRQYHESLPPDEKASSVSHSLREAKSYRGDQGEVWNGIERLSAAADVQSNTGAMKDVFEGKKSDLDDYLKAFPYVPARRGSSS